MQHPTSFFTNSPASVSQRAGDPHTSSVFPRKAWRRMGMVPRWVLFLLLAIMVFAGLFLVTTHASFARTTFSFETCANAPLQDKSQACTEVDPIQAGCVHNVKTVRSEPILLNGKKIGLAQVRYSPSPCNAYWGRGFSFLPGTSISIYIANFGISDTASYLSSSNQVYSNMEYGHAPTITVQIIVSSTQTASQTVVERS